jgi:RNA polymerase sigma-54 factor
MALKEAIEGEDPKRPYSDDKLVSIMKDKGFPIARRTIAKYREQIGIPVARLRKRT